MMERQESGADFLSDIPSSLVQRLMRRYTSPLGVIDVKHSQGHYARLTEWLQGRFPLLGQLKSRSGSDNDTPSAPGTFVYRKAVVDASTDGGNGGIVDPSRNALPRSTLYEGGGGTTTMKSAFLIPSPPPHPGLPWRRLRPGGRGGNIGVSPVGRGGSNGDFSEGRGELGTAIVDRAKYNERPAIATGKIITTLLNEITTSSVATSLPSPGAEPSPGRATQSVKKDSAATSVISSSAQISPQEEMAKTVWRVRRSGVQLAKEDRGAVTNPSANTASNLETARSPTLNNNVPDEKKNTVVINSVTNKAQDEILSEVLTAAHQFETAKTVWRVRRASAENITSHSPLDERGVRVDLTTPAVHSEVSKLIKTIESVTASHSTQAVADEVQPILKKNKKKAKKEKNSSQLPAGMNNHTADTVARSPRVAASGNPGLNSVTPLGYRTPGIPTGSRMQAQGSGVATPLGGRVATTERTFVATPSRSIGIYTSLKVIENQSLPPGRGKVRMGVEDRGILRLSTPTPALPLPGRVDSYARREREWYKYPYPSGEGEGIKITKEIIHPPVLPDLLLSSPSPKQKLTALANPISPVFSHQPDSSQSLLPFHGVITHGEGIKKRIYSPNTAQPTAGIPPTLESMVNTFNHPPVTETIVPKPVPVTETVSPNHNPGSLNLSKREWAQLIEKVSRVIWNKLTIDLDRRGIRVWR